MNDADSIRATPESAVLEAPSPNSWDYVGRSADVLGLIGLVVSIWTLRTVNGLRSKIQRKERLPDLLSKLGTSISEVSDIFGESEKDDEIDVIKIKDSIEMTQTRLASILPYISKGIKKDCKIILKNIGKFKSKNKNYTQIDKRNIKHTIFDLRRLLLAFESRVQNQILDEEAAP